MDKEHVLTLKNLNVTYKNKNKNVYAVRYVDLEFFDGDSVGIVGESGSGKSTLAMAVLRLLSEQTTEIRGQALFQGLDLLQATQDQLRNIRWKDMAVVFQKAMNSMSPVHRIGRQFEDIYRVHYPKAKKKEIKAHTIDLLKLVNLPERVYRLYPHEMSGGMLQRVAIALSLMHHPKLLFFDEATTALDVVTQGQILEEILEIEKKIKMTRIMITHDISVVEMACRKIVVMYAGEIMEVGETDKIIENPKHPYTQGLIKAYPSMQDDHIELSSIPGSLPDLSEKMEGCVFAGRCPYVMEECWKKKPQTKVLEDGRQVRCLRLGGDEK